MNTKNTYGIFPCLPLQALALPRYLVTSEAFFSATSGSGAQPWPALRSLDVAIDGSALPHIGQLTRLTRLSLRHSRNASADRLRAALAPLAGLQELEFRNVFSAEEEGVHVEHVIGRMKQLHRLSFAFPGRPHMALAPSLFEKLAALSRLAELELHEYDARRAIQPPSPRCHSWQL